MIAETFINRPVTAIVIAIILIVTGILSALNLPVCQYPDISPPVVQVSATYPGADALTVEQAVATPVEEQVNGVPGMDYMQSNSTAAGTMSLNVTFKVGTNVDIAALDVQNRVSVATPILPTAVQRLGLTVRKRNPGIMMLVAIYSPKQTHSIEFLDNYTNIFIRDALLRVKGVGDIFTRTDAFSMRIWLNPDKMASLGVTNSDITSAVQEQNQEIAPGAIGRPPQPANQPFELSLLINSRLNNPKEFENIIIKTNPEDGSIVYLKDVARVELGKYNYSGYSYVDEKRASYLLIFQEPGSNSLETAKGIYSEMQRLSESFPSDVAYMVPFEAISVVKTSIKEVVKTLIQALILVVLVVFLFLQNWRTTLIPIVAIPVSIIGSFVFFIPLGFTVNTLTLFGFVLAIGIVVDDAIIVVEAVQRYIDEQHLTPRDAALRAMQDMSGPVIAIALVLAAVFIPVGFIPGIVGKLYQQFAVTIAISVLISAFVALSLTPALCSILLKPAEEKTHERGLNKFFKKYNQWFSRVTNRYSERVKKNIAFARYSMVFLIMVLILTVVLFKLKPTGFIPLEDEGRLYITFELPEASSTSRTVDVLGKLMAELKKIDGVGHYAAIAGLNVVTFSSKSNDGTIFCQLKPWDERTSKSERLRAIIAEMQKRFMAIKEAKVVVIPPPAIQGLGSTGGFSIIIQQRESSDSIQDFYRNIVNFMVAANKREEISQAFTFFTAQTPSYQLTVDRETAKRMGVNLADVFTTLQSYLGSSYINDFFAYGRDFRVLVEADTFFRNNINVLNNFFVRNQSGKMVPLSAFITYKRTEVAPLVSHFNLYRSAEFNGEAKQGYSSGQAIQALREVADKVLPTGYSYEFSGLSRQEIEVGSKTINIFILCLVFVFLFLAALYESWSSPFVVLFAVPFAAFGAILALTLVPSLSNNIYSQIGLVTLIGLSAKNSILIVEFAKRRVDSGKDIIESTIEAVRLRLRPIIMTSMAFILGVSPLIFSSGAGAVARKTIGWTVLGGMIGATFLGIFIIPVLFVIIIRIAYRKN
jgi:HAE1 family hydrophobic/amphiphilic exporter-1